MKEFRKKKQNRKLGRLALAVLLALGTCSVASAEQTGTVFNKGLIDGKGFGFSSSNDFKKYGVWDSATKTYKFTLDSTINTKSITGGSAKVTIDAPTAELLLNSKDEYGVQSYCGRHYKANYTYKKVYDVDITAKKLILKVDCSTKAHGKEAFGIVSADGSKPGTTPGTKVTVRGDVDIDVKNKYYKEPDGSGEVDPSFTNGIATTHHGKVEINGNVKIKVRVPNQEEDVAKKLVPRFLTHYYINGIFAGLNYDKGQPGSRITISGDADVDTDGTGVHAGGQSIITIGGGGTIKSAKHNVFPYFSLNAEEGIINMNVKLNSAGKVTGAGNRPTKIYGNIGLVDREDDFGKIAGTMPTAINLGLTTSDSVLHGIVFDDFKEHGKDGNTEPAKKEQRENTGLRLYLQNGATWHNEAWGALLPTAKWNGIKHEFTGSKVLSLIGGATKETAGLIYQKSEKPITVENYSGHTVVFYSHQAATPSTIEKGDFIIKKAAPNSGIRLRTDNGGLDTSVTASEAEKSKVNATLNALANKLYYTAFKDGERNLTGEVEITEGLTTPSVSKRLENITYKSGSGQGEYTSPPPPPPPPGPGPTPPSPGPGPTPSPDPSITYGPSETVMMKETKTAVLSGILGWRSNHNDLQRRLGELRLQDTERGAWAKYFGGKGSIREQNVDLDHSFHFVQVGYDQAVNDWVFGGAFDYGTFKGDSIGGHADGHVVGMALYGVHQSDNGSYLDLILRGGRTNGDYRVSNGMIDLAGSYSSWGTSVSAEYGRRIVQHGGFYIEPSAELIFGQLQGNSHTAHGGGKTLEVHQDAFNTFVGKLNIGIGQETEQSDLFLKLGVAREFSGDFDTEFREAGFSPKRTHVSLKDTWLNLEVGGSVRLNDASYFYTTYTRTFNTDLNKQWRVDAGFRFNF